MANSDELVIPVYYVGHDGDMILGGLSKGQVQQLLDAPQGAIWQPVEESEIADITVSFTTFEPEDYKRLPYARREGDDLN